MARLTLSVRQDDGSFSVIEMDPSDTDTSALLEAITQFVSSYESKLIEYSPKKLAEMRSAAIDLPSNDV